MFVKSVLDHPSTVVFVLQVTIPTAQYIMGYIVAAMLCTVHSWLGTEDLQHIVR